MLKVVMKDTAPPFHYLILKAWTHYFGTSELSVRMPSILSGCISILLFQKITHKVFTNQTPRLLALLLYSTNAFVLGYDQTARVYSLVLTLTLGLILCVLIVMDKTDTFWTYFFIVILTTIGLWSYNIFPLIGLANLCLVLRYANNTQRIKTFVAYGVAGILYLPVFITVTLQQIKMVKETHLPFYLTVSLFIIFTPLFGGERPPSSHSLLDSVMRMSGYILWPCFLFVTGILCLKSLTISSLRVKQLWYWLLFILV